MEYGLNQGFTLKLKPTLAFEQNIYASLVDLPASQTSKGRLARI